MVDVAQSVRVVVCGTIGRGFEPHLPPKKPSGQQCVEGFCIIFLS